MQRNRKPSSARSLRLWMGLGIGLTCGMVVLYGVGAWWIKHQGLYPTTDLEIDLSGEVPYWLQTDAPWADDALGSSGFTVAQQGCAMTDVAMVLSYSGHEVTPETLNITLTEKEGYTAGGYLLWYKLEELYPGMEYTFKRVFTSGTLERDLKQGRLPIVQVDYGTSALEHWVVIVGAGEGDFWAIDPLNSSRALTPLSDYGPIYAYRLVSLR